MTKPRQPGSIKHLGGDRYQAADMDWLRNDYDSYRRWVEDRNLDETRPVRVLAFEEWLDTQPAEYLVLHGVTT